jgi:hypothetical protein
MPEYGPPAGSSTYQFTWSPAGPCTAVTMAFTVIEGAVPASRKACRAAAIVVVGTGPSVCASPLEGASVAPSCNPESVFPGGEPCDELLLQAPTRKAVSNVATQATAVRLRTMCVARRKHRGVSNGDRPVDPGRRATPFCNRHATITSLQRVVFAIP